MLKNVVALLACLATPVFAETVTVDTYAGEVEVQTRPETVAVFDIAALDTLDALGLSVDGVVAPLFVPYVADAAAGSENVGSLFEPDCEAVAAMAPDLVIAGGRSSRQVPTLSGIAPTIDMTIWEDTVGQGLARLKAYGVIFGKEAEAEALRAEFADKLAVTKAAVADQGGALIVMTNGPKVSAYGAAGRFGWLHTALELPEAVEAVEQATHGEAISFEFIKDADPEILIVIDRLAATGQDGDNAAATLDNALVKDTRAFQSGKVIYLESAPIYIAGGGIQSMMLTLDQILAAFAEG